MQISDERLAELLKISENIPEALRAPEFKHLIRDLDDNSSALRELQQLRQRIYPQRHANVNWPCHKCGQQVWLDHECPPAS